MSITTTPLRGFRAEIARQTPSARVILCVYPHSPAAEMGLKTGWHILRVGGEEPLAPAIAKAARSGDRSEIVISDENNDQVYTLSGAGWPFGAVTAPRPGPDLAKSIGAGNFDPEDLLRYWKAGLITPYNGLALSLERLMSQSSVGLLGRLMGRRLPRDELAKFPGWLGHLLLAISYAAEKKTENAAFFLAAARSARHRSDQVSFSTVESSFEHSIESLVAEQSGDPAKALDAARTAKRFGPDIPGVELRLATLEGRQPVDFKSGWTLETFPIDYTLPARDPVGEIRSNVAAVSYRDIVQSLDEGEMLVVLVMGNYRSNYYYNLDLERLAILNTAFPGRIREVHVITSGDYALDADHRRRAEGLAYQMSLPFVILWDEDATVSSAIQASESPARFLIDRTGRVLATERLMDDEGFWKAVARMKAT